MTTQNTAATIFRTTMADVAIEEVADHFGTMPRIPAALSAGKIQKRGAGQEIVLDLPMADLEMIADHLKSVTQGRILVSGKKVTAKRLNAAGAGLAKRLPNAKPAGDLTAAAPADKPAKKATKKAADKVTPLPTIATADGVVIAEQNRVDVSEPAPVKRKANTRKVSPKVAAVDAAEAVEGNGKYNAGYADGMAAFTDDPSDPDIEKNLKDAAAFYTRQAAAANASAYDKGMADALNSRLNGK